MQPRAGRECARGGLCVLTIQLLGTNSDVRGYAVGDETKSNVVQQIYVAINNDTCTESLKILLIRPRLA